VRVYYSAISYNENNIKHMCNIIYNNMEPYVQKHSWNYTDGFERNSNGHMAQRYYDVYEADEYFIRLCVGTILY